MSSEKHSNFDSVRYPSYEAYLAHQKEKTNDPVRRKKWLGEEWQLKLTFFEDTFRQILLQYPQIQTLKSIGLGARTGQEVQAMKNVGFDAIGIDLVPCPPLVIEGDIHNISFPEGHFSFAFTNVFDHSLYPEKFVTEAYRILIPSGFWLLHLSVNQKNDEYGINEISDIETTHALFHQAGFNLLFSRTMEYWGGLNWEVLVQK